MLWLYEVYFKNLVKYIVITNINLKSNEKKKIEKNSE